ncbi:type II toxin-antitoxin system YoeB family toxin [Candidatus Nitrotoga sp. BS]|uniref:type II toxin-antitoxin system YoeB family toxin n=1 Tax=Candidatus Nitrotoga sp. BS TaxID=2890408 RepID=UPI00273904F0|nr:type II toxin-antitoxin system YoeB family toxin [Candidatus Nitrotoga sp. BS]
MGIRKSLSKCHSGQIRFILLVKSNLTPFQFDPISVRPHFSSTPFQFGFWSRRITDEHRMVYRIEGDALMIAQLRFHY